MFKRKPVQISLIVVIILLFILYITAIFQRGIWYGDTFLHKTGDNRWSGTLYSESLAISRTGAATQTQLYFEYGTETENYTVYCKNPEDSTKYLKISNGNKLIFAGTYDGVFLIDNNRKPVGDIVISIGNDSHRDWHPSPYQLVDIALNEKGDLWGNPVYLFLFLITAGILLLDMKFPLFFFYLEHGLSVDNPEPSYWYYTGQKISRAIIAVILLYLVIMTFTTH